jgi:hypothetical protein
MLHTPQHDICQCNAAFAKRHGIRRNNTKCANAAAYVKTKPAQTCLGGLIAHIPKFR